MINVLLGIALVAGPLAGYLIGGSGASALIGLGLAAFAVAIYLIIDRIPLDVLAFGLFGVVGGVIVAKVLEWSVVKLDHPASYRFVNDNFLLINLFLAYLGAMIAVRKKNELDLLDRNVLIKATKSKDMKVLDTSALIDGRIADVAEVGFLSGRLVLPRFVLHELQAVADSSDPTKRQRGRRGLDVLKRLQETPDVNVKIFDKDFPNVSEVDAKIIELAKELDARVVTTDFNLSKVAVLQGVSVLNVNDLATSLKSVVLPGDGIGVYLAKEGKEKNQAVGYLDDGTMVVVDEGRRHIGKRVNVHVNSILQTPAGRMIFARVQDTRENQTDDRPGHAGGDLHAASH